MHRRGEEPPWAELGEQQPGGGQAAGGDQGGQEPAPEFGDLWPGRRGPGSGWAWRGGGERAAHQPALAHREDGLVQISMEDSGHPSGHAHHKHSFWQPGVVSRFQGQELTRRQAKALR